MYWSLHRSSHIEYLECLTTQIGPKFAEIFDKGHELFVAQSESLVSNLKVMWPALRGKNSKRPSEMFFYVMLHKGLAKIWPACLSNCSDDA